MFKNSYKPHNSTGLENCGNSCFMNSAIQMLYTIDEYRDLLLDSKINKSSPIHALQTVFTEINTAKINHKTSVNENILEKLYKIIHKSFPEKLRWGAQGDSQEFLSYLIDETIKYFNNEITKNLFLFDLESVSYCKSNNVKSNEENHIDESLLLSLDLYDKKNNFNLNNLVKKYTNVEKLETQLSRCVKTNKSYIKKNIIIPAQNKYLFIQLKRFSYINGALKFNDMEISINQTIKINNSNYSLLGVIFRKGSDNSGHYIYATYSNGKLHKVYNDSRVNTNLYDFTLDNHAYILLYIKTSEINNHIPIEKKINILNIESKKINNKISLNLATKNKLLKNEKALVLQYIKELKNKTKKIDKNIVTVTELSQIAHTNNSKQIANNYKYAKKLQMANNENLTNIETPNNSNNETNNSNKIAVNYRYAKKLQMTNNEKLTNNETNNNSNNSKQIANNYKYAKNLQKKYNQELSNEHITRELQNKNNQENITKQSQNNNEEYSKKLKNNQELSNEHLARELQNKNNQGNLTKRLQNNNEEYSKKLKNNQERSNEQLARELQNKYNQEYSNEKLARELQNKYNQEYSNEQLARQLQNKYNKESNK